MDTLKETLLECLRQETGEGLNGFSELAQNLDQTLFTIVATGYRKGTRFSFTALLVHLLGDKIIIDEDRNDEPFYTALIEAGIPREQIILAYAGEAVPNTA
jgi:hypothetical protein